MGINNINTLLNKHCRFRLRSGKDIYGILWRVDANGESYHYFTSASLKSRIEMAEDRNELILSSGTELNINDIVLAEKLVG